MNSIQAVGLKKRFNLEAGFFAGFGNYVYAVNGVSFSVKENETYGLVGESGCGKTTTARMLVRMYDADEGAVRFKESIDVGGLNRAGLREYRERVKYIFQDPAKSLNPRMSVYDIVAEPPRYSSKRKLYRGRAGERLLRERIETLLTDMGFSLSDLRRYPSEFSGGQRQRISIARGLIMDPEVLICDEVVSALDVSIQSQILNLLGAAREERGLSLVFITHDLKVACYFCDRIGVMYNGTIVEEAPAEHFLETALHPYTRLLFSCARTRGAVSAAEDRQKAPISASEGGCSFANRCPYADSRCREEIPPLITASENHSARCFKPRLSDKQVF